MQGNILKKQLIAGLIDILICSFSGYMVYTFSKIDIIFEYANPLNIVGFVYIVYTFLGFFLSNGRSPGEAIQGILLVKTKNNENSKFLFLFREILKAMLILYGSFLNISSMTSSDWIIVLVGLALFIPIKFTDNNKVIYYSIINFRFRSTFINIFNKPH